MPNKTHHELKIEKKYLVEIKKGNKTFEIRKNDRDFKVGDTFKLHEFTDGKFVEFSFEYGVITYVTDYEQKEGYVVFSFRLVK